MITIVEPKENIDRLWSKKPADESARYRLMRYVMRVDYKGKVLLHNVVTGRLVVLDETEADLLETLPAPYVPVMADLAREHYLVPEDFDEHQRVVGMRTLLRKMVDAQQPTAITTYTILPTTACNARCHYCFEQGCETVTMTEETANDVIEFIATHCGGKRTCITWFGGEPTVAARRIDQICTGLRERGVDFWSTIITNGYLLNEHMVPRAKELWNLARARICVDGTEESYNRVKNYVAAPGSPYQTIMHNIGLLLDAGIPVGLRMNFEPGNSDEFVDLVDDTYERFQGNKLLRVYAYPVTGDFEGADGVVRHQDDAWIAETSVKLNDLARAKGVFNSRRDLPYLQYSTCSASSRNAVVITPKGQLVRCLEHFDDSQMIGDVTTGPIDNEMARSWDNLSEYPRCCACSFFPTCPRLLNCSAKHHCYFSDRNKQYEIEAMRCYDSMLQDERPELSMRGAPHDS